MCYIFLSYYLTLLSDACKLSSFRLFRKRKTFNQLTIVHHWDQNTTFFKQHFLDIKMLFTKTKCFIGNITIEKVLITYCFNIAYYAFISSIQTFQQLIFHSHEYRKSKRTTEREKITDPNNIINLLLFYMPQSLYYCYCYFYCIHFSESKNQLHFFLYV